MNFSIATRMQAVQPSSTLAITAKALAMRAAGLNVISLSAGEPDFDTPEYIKKAAIAAIEAGFTKYTAVGGTPELKAAIINKFQCENNLSYEPAQIMVSVGVKHCIYNLCQALLNPGDEVIIPAPYWVSYPDIVLLAQGTPIFIPTSATERFKINAAQLAKAITPKTKLLFLNSPSNPSGVAYTKEELQALAEVLLEHPHVLIATDDIYEHILWSMPFANILNACPALYQRTIVLNGVSKAYAMTGWRIGYAAGPAPLIEAMTTLQSQATSNPCAIAQKAAVAALNGGDASIKAMVAEFHKRHDYIVERLKAINGLTVTKADGTFYLFPQMQTIIAKRGFANDHEFAAKLLEQEGLALVPGSAFGSPGCMRLSFATNLEILSDAMDRLIRFCE